MADSKAPEWLVELVANQMRLMSSNPQSVADTVWWELQKRSELKQYVERWARLGEHVDESA